MAPKGAYSNSMSVPAAARHTESQQGHAVPLQQKAKQLTCGLPLLCLVSLSLLLLLLLTWLLHHRSRPSGTLKASSQSPSLSNPQRREP
jgi:hypothetical protein